MEISNHLDKIFELGFEITLDWKNEFGIYYNASDVIPATAYSICVLRCSYYKSKHSYTFEEMVECCCDLFYGWYNRNIDKIREFDREYDVEHMDILEDSCLRDVTKQVARDLNLTDLLEMFDKHKKNSE